VSVIAVIPARYGSTRLPAKALLRDTGKYLVQHVYERVREARRIDRVIIATDDERISQAVKSFGGEVRMTRADHVSGTDRVAEVAEALDLPPEAIVLNVQGDEPEMHTESIDRLVAAMEAGGLSCGIGTVAVPFSDDGPREGLDSPLDPARVKVVTDVQGRALYFSRSLIPYPRDRKGVVDQPSRWLLHLGLYAFRASVLREVVAIDPQRRTALESTESLEQLRWLAAGYPILVVQATHACSGIDTPEDYAAFVKRSENVRK
jgi:3-deoxy-manno-octulosonate cytidylyltransferase (CMP-KDO synthetase)